MTIMVLELKVPHGADLAALRPLLPFFVSYVLSFVHLGIYWNNHHHMLQAVRHVNGRVLWANMHLLFWLSLIPATTHWIAETHFAPLPVSLYGVVLLLSGVAYYVLTRALITLHGGQSALANAVGREEKGMASLALYTAAVPLAFVDPRIACAIYVVVAILWLIPDRRIEKALEKSA